MAYETGSSSSVNDLLDKLRVFLISQGWTSNMWQGVGAGYRLHMNKNSVFINLRSYTNETLSAAADINNATFGTFYGIGFTSSDSFSAGQLWSRQPGVPFYGGYHRGGFVPNINSGIPSYHFFTYPDIDEVHVLIEATSGIYLYLGFGMLDKYNPAASGGSWSGGGAADKTSLPHAQGFNYYYSGEAIPFRACEYGNTVVTSSYVRVNIDNHDGWAGGGVLSGISSVLAIGPTGIDLFAEAGTISPYLWQTQLLPYTIYINRSNLGLSPFGEIKHLRRLDMTNYQAAEEMTLGSDIWKIFPVYQKGGYSSQRGIAVRKVA